MSINEQKRCYMFLHFVWYHYNGSTRNWSFDLPRNGKSLVNLGPPNCNGAFLDDEVGVSAIVCNLCGHFSHFFFYFYCFCGSVWGHLICNGLLFMELILSQSLWLLLTCFCGFWSTFHAWILSFSGFFKFFSFYCFLVLNMYIYNQLTFKRNSKIILLALELIS